MRRLLQPLMGGLIALGLVWIPAGESEVSRSLTGDTIVSSSVEEDSSFSMHMNDSERFGHLAAQLDLSRNLGSDIRGEEVASLGGMRVHGTLGDEDVMGFNGSSSDLDLDVGTSMTGDTLISVGVSGDDFGG